MIVASGMDDVEEFALSQLWWVIMNFL
jgi:hypothetical protein